MVARGWNPATGNPVLSLKKSFAGRLPLVQLPDGKIDLELNSIELRMRLSQLITVELLGRSVGKHSSLIIEVGLLRLDVGRYIDFEV